MDLRSQTLCLGIACCCFFHKTPDITAVEQRQQDLRVSETIDVKVSHYTVQLCRVYYKTSFTVYCVVVHCVNVIYLIEIEQTAKPRASASKSAKHNDTKNPSQALQLKSGEGSI